MLKIEINRHIKVLIALNRKGQNEVIRKLVT